MNAIERLIATAEAEIGYLEKATNSQLDDKTANAGSNNWNKFARDLDQLGIYNGKKNGYAWCDILVDWCFVQTFGLDVAMKLTCQPMGGYGAGCTSSANYYKAKGRFHTTNPQPGDQIFFTSDAGKTMYHTGLVVAVDATYVYTIEGNTSSKAGVVANGGCVRNKQYARTYAKIGGYGRPDFSIVKEEDDMTEERVRDIIKEVLKEMQFTTVVNVPPSYQGAVRKLLDEGYMSGYDTKSPETVDDNIINVDETFCRVFTILDNMGLIKKKGE